MRKIKLLLNSRSKFFKILLAGAAAVLAGTMFTAFINLRVWHTTKNQIYTIDSLPKTYQVGIILGAKVYSNGGLSGMTQDRSDRAIELYRQQKVQKILISGDHGQKSYDEVNTIKDYLLKQNIPSEDIFLDHAGFDTYDSIYRAKEIFQAESAIIITQEFHLPRALFIAQQLGLPSVGVAADIRNYGHMERVILREKLAIMKAWLDIVTQAKPKYLGETIPLTGDSKKSWD